MRVFVKLKSLIAANGTGDLFQCAGLAYSLSRGFRVLSCFRIR
jgi:hypothetical protein